MINDERKKAVTQQLAALVEEALIAEVTLSPKPGLVDALDAGAHSDMDYALFLTLLKLMSPLRDSQLPSKAVPMSCPSPLMTRAGGSVACRVVVWASSSVCSLTIRWALSTAIITSPTTRGTSSSRLQTTARVKRLCTLKPVTALCRQSSFRMGLHTPMMQPASETAVWAPRTARRKRNHT